MPGFVAELEADKQARRDINKILKFNAHHGRGMTLNAKFETAVAFYMALRNNEALSQNLFDDCETVVRNAPLLQEFQREILTTALLENPIKKADQFYNRLLLGALSVSALGFASCLLAAFLHAVSTSENDPPIADSSVFTVFLWSFTASLLLSCAICVTNFKATDVAVYDSTPHFTAWVNNFSLAIDKSQVAAAELVDIEMRPMTYASQSGSSYRI